MPIPSHAASTFTRCLVCSSASTTISPRHTHLVCQVGPRPCRQQQLHHLHVPLPRGEVQRRTAALPDEQQGAAERAASGEIPDAAWCTPLLQCHGHCHAAMCQPPKRPTMLINNARCTHDAHTALARAACTPSHAGPTTVRRTLTEVTALQSAPAASSSCAMAVWPLHAASRSGVQPSCSAR